MSRLLSARLPMRQRTAVGWLFVLILALGAVVWLFDRVFLLGGPRWTLTKTEAIEIVKEQAYDLGGLPERPYIAATTTTDPVLELVLERARREGVYPVSSRVLERLLRGYVVTVYDRQANVGDWALRAVVAADGKILTLLKGTPANFESKAVVEAAVARTQSDEFVTALGLDLAAYAEPTERRVDLPQYSMVILRYAALDRPVGERLSYGVEVRFVGDRLYGYSSWRQAPAEDAIGRELRSATLLLTYYIFVVFLVVPPLMLVFVRRYHEGVVGVRRAGQAFVIVLAAYFLLMLLTARAGSEGSSLGNATRAQTTWVFAAVAAFVFYPALAAATGMAASLGEANARGSWRARLSGFDALLRGLWTNSTVAAAALRGTAWGAIWVVVLLVAAPGLRGIGVEAPATLFGQGQWTGAAVPGLALLLQGIGVALTRSLVGVLLLVPPLVDRFGRIAGIAIAGTCSGLLFAPLMATVPSSMGVAFSVIVGIAAAWLFLRYDLLTSFCAVLVSYLLGGGLQLVFAHHPVLEIQGWLALLAGTAPLWVSLRFAGGAKLFHYQYDDIPPHVRRIAERERQRVELETARRIQSSILPELPPQLNGVEIAYRYLPASEVGGDFYDVLALEDGRLCVAVGDVAGHGVSSGLIMSMARSALAVQVTYQPAVRDVFTTLNRIVFQSARRRLLTTLCYLIVDARKLHLEYASAGHIYPYRLRRDGRLEVLESTAYPLGVRPELVVDVKSSPLAAGDILLLASDGLIEARRYRGGDEMFGFDRLEDCLRGLGGHSAEAVLDGVLEEMERFASAGAPAHASATQHDDLTLLVLRLPA